MGRGSEWAQKTELSPAGSVEQGKIRFLVFVFFKERAWYDSLKFYKYKQRM